MSYRVRIKDRIAVLEEKLGKSGNLLGQDAGLGNGTVDAWSDKPIDYSTNMIEKFLTHHRINKEWWKTGKGEIFLTTPEKKGDKLRDVDIIEAENYIGMHRRVYDSLEKSLEMFQKMALDAQKNANDLTQILARQGAPKNDSPPAQ